MRHKAQFMAKPIHAAAGGNSFFTKDLGITSVSGRRFEAFPRREGDRRGRWGFTPKVNSTESLKKSFVHFSPVAVPEKR